MNKSGGEFGQFVRTFGERKLAEDAEDDEVDEDDDEVDEVDGVFEGEAGSRERKISRRKSSSQSGQSVRQSASLIDHFTR